MLVALRLPLARRALWPPSREPDRLLDIQCPSPEGLHPGEVFLVQLTSLQGELELISYPGGINVLPELPVVGGSPGMALLPAIDPPRSERDRLRPSSPPKMDSDPFFSILRSFLGGEPYPPHLAQISSLFRGEVDDDHITRLDIVSGVYDLPSRRSLRGFLENLGFLDNTLLVLRWGAFGLAGPMGALSPLAIFVLR